MSRDAAGPSVEARTPALHELPPVNKNNVNNSHYTHTHTHTQLLYTNGMG